MCLVIIQLLRVHIFLIQVLFLMYDLQELSSTLSLHFRDGVLGRTKVFHFDIVKRTYFSFVICAFNILKA